MTYVYIILFIDEKSRDDTNTDIYICRYTRILHELYRYIRILKKVSHKLTNFVDAGET